MSLHSFEIREFLDLRFKPLTQKRIHEPMDKRIRACLDAGQLEALARGAS